MPDDLQPMRFLPTALQIEAEAGFFDEVLTGWKRNQYAQNFGRSTIRRRLSLMQRLVDFIGSYPWHWTVVDADDFFAHLRDVDGSSLSTVRAYQNDTKLFLEYAMNPSYPWNETCGRRFGMSFSQIVTDENRARHVSKIDARPSKRPFEPEELQAFFDLADLEVERCLNSGRKGALTAWRDAIAFKTLYGWGLRASEMRRLQLVDFTENRETPLFGDYGILRVRFGKAMKGSPPKQRTVYSVFDWVTEAVAEWVRKGLPRYGSPVTDLFPTDGTGLIPLSNLRERFHEYIDELGIPAEGLDLHSFRRSYSSDLQYKLGFDRAFVSLQLGHEHESTTSIYSFPAPTYASHQLKKVLDETLSAAMTDPLLRKPRFPTEGTRG